MHTQNKHKPQKVYSHSPFYATKRHLVKILPCYPQETMITTPKPKIKAQTTERDYKGYQLCQI